MANTVIAIRASGTAAATPSLGVIANGEIALNYADGIIYYKTSSNTLGSIRTTQPAGLTTEVQYNDAGSFGANSNFTFNKTIATLNVKNINVSTNLTTVNLTATYLTTGSGVGGTIAGANVIYSNVFVANTSGYVQFADGSKQYTANAAATTVSASAITGVINLTQGGTNATSYTSGAFLTSNGTAFVSVANTGTAGVYGNAAYHPVITTDAYGRVSAVTNTAIAISAAAVTSGTLAVAQGGTGVTTSTGTGSVTLNTAPTISLPTIDNIKMGYTTVATAAGTTTLTASSNYRQFFTGTTTQTIVLPVTSTLVTGIAWEIENNSTGLLTVNSSGGNLVGTIPAGVCAHFVCIGTTLTTAADWDIDYISTTTITGTGSTVLSASPTLTGTPLAPTASSGTNNTQIATTAFATSTASDLAVALAIALG